MVARKKYKGTNQLLGYTKRLRRYNDMHGTDWKESQLIVLFVVFKYQTGSGTSTEEIHLALKGACRTKTGQELKAILSKLLKYDLIYERPTRPKRYMVCINGFNMLADFENVILGSRSKTETFLK